MVVVIRHHDASGSVIWEHLAGSKASRIFYTRTKSYAMSTSDRKELTFGKISDETIPPPAPDKYLT